MDTTLGFSVSNTCGGWLRRRRNESCRQNSNDWRRVEAAVSAAILDLGRYAGYYSSFAAGTAASTIAR
jgi:hypothetical protein